MNIEVTNMKPAIAVAIRKTTISMDDLVKVMEEGYPKLMGYIAKQGKQIAGAPYCAYMNCSEDFSQFDVELGVPVSEAVSVQGEFYMGQTCEGKAITTMHKGAYKDIGAAYGALMEYAKENSLESTGVYYDYYLNDPANTPESELLTQVVYPVK